MLERNQPEDPAALVASLRALFDSIVCLPTDDPLKRQTRNVLARILDLLENGSKAPDQKVSS